MSLMTFEVQERVDSDLAIVREETAVRSEGDSDANDTVDSAGSPDNVASPKVSDASGAPGEESASEKRRKRMQRKESFFAVKNAAVIVPRSQHQHARRYASAGAADKLHKQISCQKIMSSTEDCDAGEQHECHKHQENDHDHCGTAAAQCGGQCDAASDAEGDSTESTPTRNDLPSGVPRKRISRVAMHSYLEAVLSTLDLRDRIQVMVRLETARIDTVRFLVVVTRQADPNRNEQQPEEPDDTRLARPGSASSNCSADRDSVSSDKSAESPSRKTSAAEADEASKKPSVLLGIDVVSAATEQDKTGFDVAANVGLALPVCAETTYRLDGDGGFSINFTTTRRSRYWGNAWRLKPVSIQATFSALNTLKRCCDAARDAAFSVLDVARVNSLVAQYEQAVADGDPALAADWNRHDETEQTGATAWQFALMTQKLERDSGKETGGKDGKPTEEAKKSVDLDKLSPDEVRTQVHTSLLRVMVALDLEEVSTKQLRALVETDLGCSLAAYRGMFEQCVLVVMGQLEKPSKIQDGLYLGSEWNASNLDELRRLNVRYVLNCARECDNFYASQLRYMNVRVYDTLDADLLRYWPETHAFIDEARRAGAACLVHCKMGVSRSASTVMAYCMKDCKWTLDQAVQHVRKCRPIAQPNENFMRQLATYEGILAASRRRPQASDSAPRRASSNSAAASSLDADAGN